MSPDREIALKAGYDVVCGHSGFAYTNIEEGHGKRPESAGCFESEDSAWSAAALEVVKRHIEVDGGSVPDDYLHPAWNTVERTCWRNHVPDPIYRIWDTFSPAQRMAIAASAEHQCVKGSWH